MQNDVIFKGERIVIPFKLRHMILEKIHFAHLAINGCIRRAKECLFWPGLITAIRDYVDRCETTDCLITNSIKKLLCPIKFHHELGQKSVAICLK